MLLSVRVITKKERPKWRAQVKEFLKDLQSVPARGEEGTLATELIESLYKVVAYGEGHHIFNTTNTFKAVGMSSDQFSELLTTRILANGIHPDAVRHAVSVVTVIDPSYIPHYTGRLYALAASLPTADAKIMALDQCHVVRNEIKQHLHQVRGSGTMLHYEMGKKLDMVTGLELILHIHLGEEEKAVKQFLKHWSEKREEIKMYELVKFLEVLERNELTKKTIVDAVKLGVPVREELLKKYGRSMHV